MTCLESCCCNQATQTLRGERCFHTCGLWCFPRNVLDTGLLRTANRQCCQAGHPRVVTLLCTTAASRLKILLIECHFNNPTIGWVR
jgi:hypothetical protein